MKKIIRSLLAAVTSSAMLFSMTAVMPAPEASAASDVTVTLTDEYQRIRGFGGINHPEWTGSDLSASQRQTAFGNGDGQLGMTVLRIFVNPDKNQWYKAVETAKYATQNNVTVFASPWEPPSNLAQNGDGSFQGGKLHLPKSNYAAYAQHLNDFGTYMKNQGVDLYSISVQNEPDYAKEWTGWTSDETTDFLANYGHLITSTRLMSPESFQYTNKDYYNKILNNSKAFENTDLFGTHMYGTQRSQMDFPALENCGKEIWMTEVYVPNSEANSNAKWPESIQVSENIHNALVVGNMSAYVWWYIRRSYSPMNEDGSISKRGYCMAQYSKYVRPGYIRVGATEQPDDKVLVSAYKGGGDKVVIVAVNSSSTEYNKNFTITGAEISNVNRFRTSQNENIAPTLDMKYNGSSFNAQLPAQSVSTFVVTVANASGFPTGGPDEPYVPAPIEPDENGYYFHDTFEANTFDWEGRGAASVLTSGRTAYEGKEALLVQERTSAWHGAAKALNSRAFEPGKAYSFSVDAVYFDGAATDTFYLKLEYKGSDGETHYASIAEASAIKGEWVQLANTSYTIPEDATDMRIYVETPETTNNFYIDEAIGAVEGTVVKGPEPSAQIILGDVSCDGVINALDIALARKGTVSGYASTSAKLAADVNCDEKNDITDVVLIQSFVLGRISEFPYVGSPEPEKSEFNYEANLQYKAAPDYYLNEGSKKGTVIKETYDGINGSNTLNVYLPYGYDSSKKYNIFYLMHGGGENENTIFSSDVKLNNMLDHMIENGDIEPMIVVTPTFNKCQAETVWDEVKQSIVPFVEGKYSTYADNTTPAGLEASRMHRAYGGFSMGGGSTWNVLINDIDYFGYYMPLSGHCWGGASAIENAISGSKYKDSTYILAATGTDDIAYDNLKPQIDSMKNMSVFTYTSDFSKGNLYFLEASGLTHWWGYVRHYVYDALPYFFHE